MLNLNRLLWCFLHSCPGKDWLFSGTSYEFAAAIKPHHKKRPSCLRGTHPSGTSHAAAGAFHPSRTTGSISQNQHHAIRRLGGLWALLQHDDLEGLFQPRWFCGHCNAAGVSVPWAHGHPSRLVPGIAPSSPQLEVWDGNSYLGRDLQGCWATTALPGGMIQKLVAQKVQTDGKQGKSFALNNQYKVDIHHRLLLFAIFYRSFRLRPQISFRLVEMLFISVGFGSGPF